MSLMLEQRLRSVVIDFDALIAKCELIGLPEVVNRLIPIRDVIQQGIELREAVQRAAGKEV